MTPVLPQIVLAGAPKCGTSSLFRWLAAHPQVCGTQPKEPCYFLDAEHPLLNPLSNYHKHGLEGWRSNLPADAQSSGPRGASAIQYCEATTHLMYQQTALTVLPTFDRPPKVIFLLRDPVRRLQSSFHYTSETLGRVRRGLDFEAFANLLLSGEQAAVGQYIRGEASAYVLARDLEYGQYFPYLSRWEKALGRAGMLVVQFERLIAKPEQVLQEVLTFIGLPSLTADQLAQFVPHNRSTAVRARALHFWARKASQLPGLRPLTQRLRGPYHRLQLTGSGPRGCSAALERRLRSEYERSNGSLAERFGIDLALWQ